MKQRHHGEPRSEILFGVGCMAAILAMVSPVYSATAEAYNPAWISELGWVGGTLYSAPTGAGAYVEDAHSPWWHVQTAHPIDDYSASKIPVGSMRVDGALDLEYTLHRAKRSWDVVTSPSGINNVYTFTPGSSQQEDRTGRAGQNAYLNLGFHPTTNWMGDIGIEAVGNYDQRFWFPVNDEHRLHKDDDHVKIVRGELKYDNETFMLRGFEGTPNFNWVYQNDLFQLLPTQTDVERYRRMDGGITPRGGELRYKSALGTLDVLGGTEPRFTYGPSVYVKYDAPAWGSWENSWVYRNEEIPFSFDPEERRWTFSYNSSWELSENVTSHAGLLYQPFRLDTPYQDENLNTKRTKEGDALGVTWRVETRQWLGLDSAGLGYTYLGPVAGNKHQLDADAGRLLAKMWNFSTAYTYRKPVIGPEPLRYEGTAVNPGALISNPRGPDDPFWVQWDNREAHIASLTLIYDATPETYMFRYQKNVLEDWNLNTDEDSTWSGALQYRVTHYPTNTDRLYYFDEDRHLMYDPIFREGALATSYPFSSATGLLRWKQNDWQWMADLSGGQAAAGNAIAYTSATNFYKPTTSFVNGGLAVVKGPLKVFGRYGQDVWGPEDYHIQQGWAYHRVYQAGLNLTFLRDFLAGFRYIGTRMTEDFIGSDTGAFNEFRFFLTYHFGATVSLGQKHQIRGREAKTSTLAPEVSLTASTLEFSPDGSGPHRTTTFAPKAVAEAGLYSWKLLVQDATGAMVKQWEGPGDPPAALEWNGLAVDGKPLPVGTYEATLTGVDRQKKPATSTIQTIKIVRAEAAKEFTTTVTQEGLRVTLSSKVLFDTGKNVLKLGAQRALDQVVELLRTYPTNKLRVTGHTDSVGGTDYNQRLSERRAHAVADYLVKKGIVRSRMTLVGLGKGRPTASNKDDVGRAQNRRVEIDILK